MKVYIVVFEVNDIYDICGIFSSEEKAKEYIHKQKIRNECYYIEEFEIDNPDNGR
jgi:hypothetical protein